MMINQDEEMKSSIGDEWTVDGVYVGDNVFVIADN
jgi:hypothetical protein